MKLIPNRPSRRPPDIDDTLRYRNLGWGDTGKCRARVWFPLPAEIPAPLTVLATEVADNTGPSVTNSAEAVASALEVLLRVEIDGVDLVEHYGASLFRPHAFAVVTFAGRDAFGRPASPSWEPLPGRLAWLEDDVAALVPPPDPPAAVS